ncbi:hypothetical protein NDU88_005950 [Pleurodeles waltl]|uniref:Uncharacterized protein n=1 Tax=Pleurodeles waltl TaxID=8319 RepID=A0AAV7SN51_PLEWA|nr:hypothetical protein NDU88_005950 [Pleurodeles waltl]
MCGSLGLGSVIKLLLTRSSEKEPRQGPGGLKALGGRGSVLEEPGLELHSEGEVFGYGAKVTGQGVPGLRCQKREGFSSGGGFADAGNGCQGLTGGAQSARRSVEGDAGVDEFGSEVVEGFVCVGEESEGDPLVDREPMEFSQVSGDVVVARYVQDESCCGVLDPLKFPLQLGGDAGVQSVPVVQAAGDEGVGDGLPGVDGDPAEDLAEHAEGVEAR